VLIASVHKIRFFASYWAYRSWIKALPSAEEKIKNKKHGKINEYISLTSPSKEVNVFLTKISK